MGCILSEDSIEFNKAKEINFSTESKAYEYILFNKKITKHNMNRIQRKLNKIGTCYVWKISSSCFDDKKYILDDGITTLAYFHEDLKDSNCF